MRPSDSVMILPEPLVDYSIEYCHIYTNEDVSDDHIASVEALQEIVDEFHRQGTTYNLCVLIDDYSFPETSLTFDYDRLLQWLTEQQAAPHFLINEASLVRAADEVTGLITDQQRRRTLQKYIKHKRYPCSLFIATWYLARLGRLRTVAESEIPHATRLINILPERFDPFESEARDILSATPYVDVLNCITNKYIGAHSRAYRS